jgi:hypothetical protein
MFCPSFFCNLADISSSMHGDHERWTKLVHSARDCARIDPPAYVARRNRFLGRPTAASADEKGLSAAATEKTA